MRNDADALQEAPLFKHRPCAPNNAPHDRIVALSQNCELPLEIVPNIRAEFVETRPEDFPRIEASVVANVSKDWVLHSRWQWIPE
jgi:hypothetical protein